MRFHMVRDAVFAKKGPGNWLRRIYCWWGGEHVWTGSHSLPMPLRPKVCKRCGAKWEYIYIHCPPPRGQVWKECPKCWNISWHKVGESTCTCGKCGVEFAVQTKEQWKCKHCGRMVSVGEECKGCGAPQ